MPENDTIMNEEFVELDTLETLKSTAGKIMAVDFGDTRTGLAVSDGSRFLASGIGYVSPGGIEKTAQAILDASLLYPEISFADLYGEKMYLYPELCKAHQANDKAVMKAYGYAPTMTEPEIVADLMKRYQELTK